MRRVNEQSYYKVTASFFEDGVASLPDTVDYQIYCKTTGTLVRDWTSVTPAESVEITATATDNAIINDVNAREVKQMTIRANAGTDTQYIHKVEWEVVNLGGYR